MHYFPNLKLETSLDLIGLQFERGLLCRNGVYVNSVSPYSIHRLHLVFINAVIESINLYSSII